MRRCISDFLGNVTYCQEGECMSIDVTIAQILEAHVLSMTNEYTWCQMKEGIK